MKREFIDINEVITNILPKTLKKDLQDNERICPSCHGLGVIAVHNVYGLKDDPNPDVKGVMFPYDHESLIFCPDCYNGVQSLCEFCGKPIQKGYINSCTCEGHKKNKEEKAQLKWQETITKAKEVQPEDVNTYLYCEENNEYYSDVDEFVNLFDFDGCDKPERLWVTTVAEIELDAMDIVENACYDLHEDAFKNCDCDSLQIALDEWCNNQSDTTTFYPHYKEYVLVKDEWLEE